MKYIRTASTILLTVPIAILIYAFFHPRGYWPGDASASEMLLLIFGIPIIFLNILVWSNSEIAEEIFLSKWEFNANVIAFIAAVSLFGLGLLVTMFIKPPAKRQPVVIYTRARNPGALQTASPIRPTIDPSIPYALPTPSIPTPTTRPRPDSPLVIYYNGSLENGFGMGVNTSGHRTDWVTPTSDGGQCMAYPDGQTWGAVFITIGEPGQRPHPSKDFSGYGSLSVELRGESGGESIQIGLKSSSDPDDGSETKHRVWDLTSTWNTFEIPLSTFSYINLSELYVVTEFVFEDAPQTVCFRNIQFLP